MPKEQLNSTKGKFANKFYQFLHISITKLKLRKKRFVFTIIGTSLAISFISLGFTMLAGGMDFMKKMALSELTPREFKEVRVYKAKDNNIDDVYFYEGNNLWGSSATDVLFDQDINKLDTTFPEQIVSPLVRIGIRIDNDRDTRYDFSTVDLMLQSTIDDAKLKSLTYKDFNDISNELIMFNDPRRVINPNLQRVSITLEGVTDEWLNTYKVDQTALDQSNQDLPIIISKFAAQELAGIQIGLHGSYREQQRLMTQEQKNKINALIGDKVLIFLTPPRNFKDTDLYQGKIITATIVGLSEIGDNLIPLPQAQEMQTWLRDQANKLVRDDNAALVFPLSKTGYESALIYVEDFSQVSEIVEQLKLNKYQSQSYLNEIEFIKEVTSILFKILFVGAAIIAVLVALLIMNTIGKIITDSRKEIGVFRALGAKKRQVISIFMIEAYFLGIIGTLIGIILGWLGTILVSWWIIKRSILESGATEFLEIRPFFLAFPILYYLLILLAVLILISITGYARARKASKLSIVKALKEELR